MANWVCRMVSKAELNLQEQCVADVLKQLKLAYQHNYVFKTDHRVFVVDFRIPQFRIVLECTYCNISPSKAISELVKRCAYFDYKFRRVKASSHEPLIFGVLAEAPSALSKQVRENVSEVMENAGFIATTIEELQCFFQGLQLGIKLQGESDRGTPPSATNP